MSNNFLEPASQGISGILKALMTSSVDRANKINRAVCEYNPCSVDTFFPHPIIQTIPLSPAAKKACVLKQFAPK